MPGVLPENGPLSRSEEKKKENNQEREKGRNIPQRWPDTGKRITLGRAKEKRQREGRKEEERGEGNRGM